MAFRRRCAGITAVPVLDERSSRIFCAGLGESLGAARWHWSAASGAAAANHLPASCWRRRQAGVRLLVLTADRPAELRGVQFRTARLIR
jgi:2-succinyl-5-enolpyruvyl-6-hydroxy-3-cyclohexene-1-carboxylate synthase